MAFYAADGSTLSAATRYDGYGQTIGTYTAGSGIPSPWGYQGRLDLSTDADHPLYDAGARNAV